MAGNVDHLKIVENIFGLVSEDTLSDCEKIIREILRFFGKNDSPSGETTNSSKITDSNAAIISLKVLLEFYESLISRCCQKESVISFELILQVIDDLLQDHYEEFDPSRCVEQELLHIVRTLFEIACLRECEENLSALARFYDRNLEEINRNYASENCNVTNVNSRLKILCCFYSVPESDSKYVNAELFFKAINELKIRSNIKEHKLLANLVICGSDDVLKKTLLFVIPNFMKCFNDIEVMETVWKNISNLLSNQNSSVEHSRMLLVTCYLFNLCFLKKNPSNKKLMKLLFEDKNYWKLIQSGLGKRDPLMRKQAMFLFKNTVDLLENSNENVVCCNVSYSSASSTNSDQWGMWWDENYKNEFLTSYKEIIVILEFLWEQQVHIIRPVFKMIEEAVGKILRKLNSNKAIDFSWIVLVYEQALKHESMQVVKWALDSLLSLSGEFYSYHLTVERIVSLLVSTLNCTSLYYSDDGFSTSNKLEDFLIGLAKLITSKLFFKSFISNVCSLNWSPEALYFVMRALAQVPRNSCWQENEITQIKSFFVGAFQTKKFIRIAIQVYLLNSLMALTDCESVSLETVVLFLSNFSNSESLRRDGDTWRKLTVWMRDAYGPEEAKNCLERALTRDSAPSSAFMLELFFHSYQSSKDGGGFSSGELIKMLNSFGGIHPPDKSKLDGHLAIFCHLLEGDSNRGEKQMDSNRSTLSEMISPHLPDLAIYIKSQSSLLSEPEDFQSAQLYARSLRSIMAALGHATRDAISGEFLRLISREFEIDSLPSVRIYSRAKLLKSILEIDSRFTGSESIRFDSIRFRLAESVNDPLPTETETDSGIHLEKSHLRKLNSDHVESKWNLLDRLIGNDPEIPAAEEILKTRCEEAVETGCSPGVLCHVMSVARILLGRRRKSSGWREIIDSIWIRIAESRRKTDSDSFGDQLKAFVEMLFQTDLIEGESIADGIHSKYVDLIFSESSRAAPIVLMKQFQSLDVRKGRIHPIFCHVLSRALIYGPVLRKDERLSVQICHHVESSEICRTGECRTSNEVRARAIQMILSLDKTSPDHQSFAWDLIEKLIRTEKELNKNKIRHFGDSQVHRVKHRLLQALLLLEPAVKSNQVCLSSRSDSN